MKVRWWRGFWAAVVLGWQEQFNWIRDPVLLAIYLLIRPVATVALLVVMYGVATQGAWEHPLFAYMYVGNALYIYVGNLLQVMSWTIIDEREHYRTLKYVVATPTPLLGFLAGRAVVPLGVGTLSVLVVLVVGWWVFSLPLDVATVDWPRVGFGLGMGWAGLLALGLLLAAVTLNSRRYMWAIGEGVAGVLYVCTGALFPLTVLPRPLQVLGMALPVTYWLEWMRRALLPTQAVRLPPWEAWSDARLLGTWGMLTAVYGVLGVIALVWAEGRARWVGLLDATSDY